MFSIQECVDKTAEQRRRVETFMDTNGYYDPKECRFYDGLKRSVQREIMETLRKISLAELLVTPSGLTTGTLGAAGVQYLVPTWISSKLYQAHSTVDLVPLVSADILDVRGGEVTVPIGKMRAHIGGEAGTAMSSYTGTGATLSLKKLTVPMAVTSEMLEDNQFGLVEWMTAQAAEAISRRANDIALEVLRNASDGFGTRYYSLTGDADETKYTGGATSDILVAWAALSHAGYIGNTLVCTPESWEHSISQTTTAATMDAVAPVQIDERYDVKLATLNLDVVFATSESLHDSADLPYAAMTACYSVVFDRRVALVTGRKDWLRIENYANPVQDLAGAVVSGRQDSVTVVDQAIAVLMET